MKNPWAKAAAVLIGILLLLLAVGMLTADSGFVQSGRNNALAYLVGLLGLGLIAAAFFGDTLKYDGEHSGPLGKVIATGGAAVFVIGLIFILAVEDGPAPTPTPQPTQVAGHETDREPAPAPTTPNPEATRAAVEPTPSPTLPPEPAPRQVAVQPPAAIEASTPGYYLAWTYCSTCCPQGPDFCEQVGIGEGADAQSAADMAVRLCTQNGGVEQTCRANVQFTSAADLGF